MVWNSLQKHALVQVRRRSRQQQQLSKAADGSSADEDDEQKVCICMLLPAIQMAILVSPWKVQ